MAIAYGFERREIGSVTSGSPAPFLKKNIALAYVPGSMAELGRWLRWRFATIR